VGVDTKAILLGNPNAAEIAQVISDVFGFEPDMRIGLDHEEVPTYFILTFPDTQEKGRDRRLNIHLNCDDYREVHGGAATVCSLGLWGGFVEIMEALASKFGGYICDSDFVGDWRVVERVDDNQPVKSLSPAEKLNLTLSKVIDPKAAVELRKVLNNPGQFGKLMDALDVYRAELAATV
jgi:hypothetical protein